jgi:plastocyanin
MLAALLALLASPGLLSAGTVAGKVTYTGSPARQRIIDMGGEPSCAAQHPTPLKGETVVTGPDNGLANVVVYVSAGANDEGQAPQQAVVLEQKGCQYIPHVVPVHTNQEVQIVNHDPVLHNIHPLAKANREWNRSETSGSSIGVKFDKAEFIPVKCNVHPWMRGWLAVLNTSHYDISKEDGSYRLVNLPPGKYTLAAWHEAYGIQTTEVIIGGNETKRADFIFKATGN